MATTRLLTRRSLYLSHAPLFHALHSPFPSPTSHPHVPHLLSLFHSSVNNEDSPSHSVPIPSETFNWSDRVTEITTGEDSILPVRALISLLDGFHDLTGLPWWMTIASSAVALRIMLFPAVVLQMRKLKRIAELFPELPPPLPPPLSGRSFIDQISLFRRERRAIGCPSFLWFFAAFSIQIPCFLLFVTSIRRMSLDDHPGFDCVRAQSFQY